MAESKYTGTKYVKVTLKGVGRKRATSFWATVETRGKRFNLYVPVDKEGRDFSRETKKGVFILRKDLVEHGAILKEEPARMTKKYGELEVVKKT